MEYNYEGEVSYERTSDTGDPSFDFDYKVDGNTVKDIKDILRYHEGSKIRLKIIVEELSNKDSEDDD